MDIVLRIFSILINSYWKWKRVILAKINRKTIGSAMSNLMETPPRIEWNSFLVLQEVTAKSFVSVDTLWYKSQVIL